MSDTTTPTDLIPILSDADPPLTMTTAARPTTTEPPVPGTPAVTKIVVDVNCCPCSCPPPSASPECGCCPSKPEPPCSDPACSCNRDTHTPCCQPKLEDPKIGDGGCCPSWMPFFNKF